MELGDLLFELRENVLHDRSDQVAGTATDRLWSDQTLVRYIDQAQRRFARQALVIRDGYTPEVTQITVKTGVTTYPMHESILGVISALFDTDPCDLARAGHYAFNSYHVPDTYFFDPGQLSSLPPGKPLAYGTDEYLGADDRGTVSAPTFRLYPEPIADYNNKLVKLRVVRMPLYHLRVENLDMEPEIPEEHHIDMLDWAAYLALRIVDVDAGWPQRAAEFRASFEENVKRARDVVMRKLFTPMQWGFGRNGWTYEI